jgi:hypothetical protein
MNTNSTGEDQEQAIIDQQLELIAEKRRNPLIKESKEKLRGQRRRDSVDRFLEQQQSWLIDC